MCLDNFGSDPLSGGRIELEEGDVGVCRRGCQNQAIFGWGECNCIYARLGSKIILEKIDDYQPHAQCIHRIFASDHSTLARLSLS